MDPIYTNKLWMIAEFVKLARDSEARSSGMTVWGSGVTFSRFHATHEQMDRNVQINIHMEIKEGMMNPTRKICFMWTGACVLTMLISACAAPRVASPWRDRDIVADGSGGEWPAEPQYRDDRKGLTVQVTNDAEAIYLCICASGPKLAADMDRAGVTVVLDPRIGDRQTFGMHLPGQGGPPFGEHPGPGARPEGDRSPGPPPSAQLGEPDTGEAAGPKDAPPMKRSKTRPRIMEVTYSDTTGPIKITIPEALKAGIEIGESPPDPQRALYEFKIKYTVDTAVAAAKENGVLWIGIMAGSMDGPGDIDRPEGGGPGRGGPPGGPGGSGDGSMHGPPGGGMPGGGSPGGMEMTGTERTDTDKVWLEVQLARG